MSNNDIKEEYFPINEEWSCSIKMAEEFKDNDNLKNFITNYVRENISEILFYKECIDKEKKRKEKKRKEKKRKEKKRKKKKKE
jgi:hypothetical protein